MGKNSSKTIITLYEFDRIKKRILEENVEKPYDEIVKSYTRKGKIVKLHPEIFERIYEGIRSGEISNKIFEIKDAYKKHLKDDEKEIILNQKVGVIELNDLRIQILPKILKKELFIGNKIYLNKNDKINLSNYPNSLCIQTKNNRMIYLNKEWYGILEKELGKDIFCENKLKKERYNSDLINISDYSEVNEEKKAIKLYFKMLNYYYDFNKSIKSGEINFEQYELDVFEIHIYQFLLEVEKLVKQGLKSFYFPFEDNLKVLKGKLLFDKHFKKNIVDKTKFFVRYDEFGVNILENQILKNVLNILKNKTKNTFNKKMILRLMPYFEEVEQNFNIKHVIKNIGYDRNNFRYKNALEMVKIFIEKNSFIEGDTNKKDDLKVTSLVFNMEDVFEKYVVRRLIEINGNSDIEIIEQKEKMLFPDKDIIKIKPDIYMENKKTKKNIVLDTKWKLLDFLNREENYKIKREDIYQIYTYFKAFNSEKAYILYPNHSHLNKEKVEIKGKEDFLSKENNFYHLAIDYKLFFVNLEINEKNQLVDNLEDLYKYLKEDLK